MPATHCCLLGATHRRHRLPLDAPPLGRFSLPMSDGIAAQLVEAVRTAGAEGYTLRIVGAGSKAGLRDGAVGSVGAAERLDQRPPAPSADAVRKPSPSCALPTETLSVAAHAGVIDYRPEELVLTARCGTSLEEINGLLARRRQHLPFEPPMLGGGGTLGGAVAAGCSGPGRPWRGSVRDAVLGVEMINGLGQRLRFGGQVMKNVAGYDLSRLQVGAWGTLGVLLSISVRLSPAPEVERNCRLQCDAAKALDWVRTSARTYAPISGTCHQDGRLDIRLSGPERTVAAAARRIGGELSSDVQLWRELRDRAAPFFRRRSEGRAKLWRIDCAPAAKLPPSPCLTEWAGARRWWHTALPPDAVQAYAAEAGGSAAPAHGAANISSPMMARLRQAFDPQGVLNPDMFSELLA